LTLQDLGNSIALALTAALAAVVNYLPAFFGGLIVLLIGLLVGTVVNRLILALLKMIKFEGVLARYNLSRVEGQEVSWSHLIAEVGRWFIVVVFLIPALQVWRIEAATTVLNRILFYLPNVLVAIIVALVGLVFARLGSEVAYTAAKNLGKDIAHTVSLLTRWAIKIFTVLVVLNQLGIAADLIRILFIGLVAMLAIAGGLAFGLGGSDIAKEVLAAIRDKLRGK